MFVYLTAFLFFKTWMHLPCILHPCKLLNTLLKFKSNRERNAIESYDTIFHVALLLQL